MDEIEESLRRIDDMTFQAYLDENNEEIKTAHDHWIRANNRLYEYLRNRAGHNASAFEAYNTNGKT